MAGTVSTDDAIGFDPLPLLEALDEQGTHVVVIGQVAGIMHGSRELTGDLDLLWDGDQGQARVLAAAFTSVSAVLADQDGAPVRCEPVAFELPKVLFRSPAASGDCCTPALPWGGLPVADFIARCETVTAASGFKIRYLAREDLIRMRRAIGRPKDLRRAAELEHPGLLPGLGEQGLRLERDMCRARRGHSPGGAPAACMAALMTARRKRRSPAALVLSVNWSTAPMGGSCLTCGSVICSRSAAANRVASMTW